MSDIKFQAPNCLRCTACKRVGYLETATAYCTAGKKPRRLPKAGIKRKVADWCPKKISPPRCRIFGFIDEEQENLDFLMHRDSSNIINGIAFPSAWRYKVRCTYPLDMSAKQFCEELKERSLQEIFSGTELSYGEVIEIDDGFKPYYFYFSYEGKIVPIHLFDVEKAKEGE